MPASALRWIGASRGHFRGTGRNEELFESSPVAMVAVDSDELVVAFNPAAEALLGLARGDVIGYSVSIGELATAFTGAQRVEAPSDSPLRTTLRYTDPSGITFDLEVLAAATHDRFGHVDGSLAVLVDVTDREQAQRQLRHQATYDSLTGLPNRDLFADEADQLLVAAARTGAQTGLLLIDLNRFKEVNDTFGHLAGDQLLAQIGPRLLAGTLRSHDLIARLSGSEFVVALPELAGTDVAVEVAGQILSALHAPFVVAGTSVTSDITQVGIAASIGVSVAPGHGDDLSTLMRHADVAMYEAKESGDGVVLYEPGQGLDRAPTRFGLLGQLRHAVDAGELVLYYQPKIDLSSGRLHSVEALVRWAHPGRGLLAPAEFIPLAETTGLIKPLTERVLDLAITQAKAWVDKGRAIPVAVNLSAKGLHDASLVEKVLTVLEAHQVPAELLWLEITETAVMHNPPGAVAVLRLLADAGVRISLDDFGTGYSSMTYLRELPIAELKIDRSFITGLGDEQADQVIARSTIDLGHNLGLTVVAEGVEDTETLRALHVLNCDIAQGFLIAHPMPPEDFDAWMADHP